jgi:acetyl-CoA acetyltransferase family protein
VRFDDVVIPLGAAWSSPFVRWQGPTAEISSLDLAVQVTGRALKRSGVEWPVDEVVFGLTVPQQESFYGTPTIAARLGFAGVSGPMIHQACATSVACLHVAAANANGRRSDVELVVTADRISNSPVMLWPSGAGPGGAPRTEHWTLDNFERDPVTGESMLATAEAVAAEAGFAKQQLDELTVRRYEQYEDALADDRAFQREWMISISAGSRREPLEIDADWGVRPVTAEGLAGLEPVRPGGVTTYGTQTHPADGAAGMIVTTVDRARELGVEGPLARILATGFARVEPGRMPKAPIPAARTALAAAGLDISALHAIKTHNPFAVNDLWFERETGVDATELNPFGCSLIYGHPQGPTGARGLVELAHVLKRRGGGVGLFTGCAAGDTGAAVVIEVDG